VPLLSIADLNQPQQDLAPYIELATSLSQMYFDHIARDQDEGYSYTVEVSGGKGRAAGIHASEISKCLKLVVYSINGTERRADSDTADVNMLMRFRLGTAIHAMMQNDWYRIATKSSGRIHFQAETPIHPGIGGPAQAWNIHSACDGIVTFLDEAGHPILRVGIEIKSMSDGQFDKVRQPQSDHKEQTTLYMATLNLPLMWVIYYNKSNSTITTSFPPFVFQFDKKLWEHQLEMRFAKAHHYAEKGALPPGTEGQQCSWCPFSYTCKPTILKPRGSVRPTVARGMLGRK
jgi:CRISPR/Cas system-associated exonuclease Cas4 (RecB family)